MNQISIQRAPCASCPYRKDVPSGIWHSDEYDKIIEHHDRTVLDRWRVATDYCIDNCVYDKPARIAVFESFGAG